MTEFEKLVLAELKLDRQEEKQKIKKYQFLIDSAKKRLAKIEKEIEEIQKTY